MVRGKSGFGSALRRSSLDEEEEEEEEVVCGGQAWPAYQIRGVFWSCSTGTGPGFPREPDSPTISVLPPPLLPLPPLIFSSLLRYRHSLSSSRILLVRRLYLLVERAGEY